MDEFEKVKDDLLKKQLGENYKQTLAPKKNMPTENDMGPSDNKAKGIELKLGPAKKEKPTDLNPVVKKKGGMVSSASKRADGCCTKGKTKGKLI
jgi:hypothetical protein